MRDVTAAERIRQKYRVLSPVMDERMRRQGKSKAQLPQSVHLFSSRSPVLGDEPKINGDVKSMGTGKVSASAIESDFGPAVERPAAEADRHRSGSKFWAAEAAMRLIGFQTRPAYAQHGASEWSSMTLRGNGAWDFKEASAQASAENAGVPWHGAITGDCPRFSISDVPFSASRFCPAFSDTAHDHCDKEIHHRAPQIARTLPPTTTITTVMINGLGEGSFSASGNS